MSSNQFLYPLQIYRKTKVEWEITCGGYALNPQKVDPSYPWGIFPNGEDAWDFYEKNKDGIAKHFAYMHSEQGKEEAIKSQGDFNDKR